MNKKKLILVLAGNILLGSIAYFAYYFQKNDEPTVKEITEQRAFQWAQWLIENKFQIKYYKTPPESSPSATRSTDRGLASAEVVVETRKTLDGDIGRDPWGQPFQFHVQGEGSAGSTISVWSIGENGTLESSSKEDLISKGAHGDDILIQVPVK